MEKNFPKLPEKSITTQTPNTLQSSRFGSLRNFEITPESLCFSRAFSVLPPKALSSKHCLSNFIGEIIFERLHLAYVYLFIIIYVYIHSVLTRCMSLKTNS